MLLDTWNTIFLWVGKDSSESEQENIQEAATDYLACDPSGRKGILRLFWFSIIKLLVRHTDCNRSTDERTGYIYRFLRRLG